MVANRDDSVSNFPQAPPSRMERGRKTDDAEYMEGQEATKGKSSKSNGDAPVLDQTVMILNSNR